MTLNSRAADNEICVAACASILFCSNGGIHDKKMFVTARFTSGFGNRLFMAAAAAWYARKHDRQFVLVDDLVEESVHDSDSNSLLFRVLASVPRHKRIDYNDATRVREADMVWPTTAKWAVLDGYFQNEIYADALHDHVQAYLQDLQSRRMRSDACFVHVRLKDYTKQLFNIFWVPHKVEYYKRATRLLRGPYLVVSDDPPGALHFLQSAWQPKAEYTKHPKRSICEDFETMVMCSRGIVCNSTFSWWAAKLLTWSSSDVRSAEKPAPEKPVSEPFVAVPSPWSRKIVDLSYLDWIPGFRWAPLDLGNPQTPSWIRVEWPTNDGLSASEMTLIGLLVATVYTFYITFTRRTSPHMLPVDFES